MKKTVLSALLVVVGLGISGFNDTASANSTEDSVDTQRVVEERPGHGDHGGGWDHGGGGWDHGRRGRRPRYSCNEECSAPHHYYEACMEDCIREACYYRDFRAAHEAIRDLCASPHHDERACLREHEESCRR